MTYFPKVLISSQGGPLSSRPRTFHAGPRLVTSGLQAPPAATFFRYFFAVLLDFIHLPPPSQQLPKSGNFTDLHFPLLPLLGLQLLSLPILLPNPCIVMLEVQKPYLSTAKSQRHPWRARPALVEKWSESESAAAFWLGRAWKWVRLLWVRWGEEFVTQGRKDGNASEMTEALHPRAPKL